MTVLIVDDNENNLYFLEVLLKGNGYEVDTAENGAEALEKIKNGSVELIISDVLMPVMDGFQLCRNVKTDQALCHIPFVIYTATYTGPQDEDFAAKLGADRFIIKPCDPDIFIQKIHDVAAVAGNGKTPDHREFQSLHEEEMLKLYSERLVRKLEQKMIELEKEVQARRETEAELRQTNSFLNSIIENIPDMIFLKDAKELRFVRFNKAGEKLLGYSREQLIGKNDYDFFPKDQASFFTQKDQEVLLKKEIVEIPQETVQTCRREERILSTKKVPILDDQGTPLYLLCISADITEAKRAEQENKKLAAQLQQAQKLEAIGNLASGIAHDFNNILSVIIGFTQLALDDAEKDSVLEDDLKEINTAGKRAKELVRQILAFARKSEEEMRSVKPSIIIKEVLKFIRSSIPATIEIRQNIESDSYIMGNLTQIHQILMNLCTNAAHAMEEQGGLLEVSLKDIDKTHSLDWGKIGLKQGDYIEIVVSDTGTGISPEIIDLIFDPYFTTKGPGEGTGLGLAVIQGIIETNGGKITVKSTPEKGTVFTVYLPIAKKQATGPSQKSGDLPTGTERILLIDDESAILKMGKRLLEQFGYSVETRISSIEALELFRNNPNYFDLVITDLEMPKISGDKLAIELMKISPDIPVILCTGYNKRISAQFLSEIGIKAFVPKPFEKENLVKTIRNSLNTAKSEKKA